MFWRVRGLPDEDDPKESREGLCSLTDMVRLCGQRYIAATRLCGPQEPASSRRTRVQAKGAGGVCAGAVALEARAAIANVQLTRRRLVGRQFITSIDIDRCFFRRRLASTVIRGEMAEMVCRISLSSLHTFVRGGLVAGLSRRRRCAEGFARTDNDARCGRYPGSRLVSRHGTDRLAGRRNGSLDRLHELMTGQILYDQATGLQLKWYTVDGGALGRRCDE